MMIGRNGTALVYSENEFGKIDGKVANGLVRHSEKYRIIGIIDSARAGLDAGTYLDGVKNGIPIYSSISSALSDIGGVPEYFIYGIAPLASYLDRKQRGIILSAIEMGMSIVNGLPEFFSEDKEFTQKARQYGVNIHDIRKPPPRKKLHIFSGRIHDVDIPVIAVLGTDCAVGKRTTTVRLVEALKDKDLNAVFIATGQTGLLQGARYGIAVDVLSSGYASGEVENAIMEAYENEHPDIIVVEGALSHPAFTSSSAIVKGAVPRAVVIQHPPKRKSHCDFPNISMPRLESEISLIEVVSKSKVIAISINHEGMNAHEVESTITEYEHKYKIPTTDVLKHGCDKIVRKLLEIFPVLQRSAGLIISDPGFQAEHAACRLQE